MSTSNESLESLYHLPIWNEEILSEIDDRSAVNIMPVPNINQRSSADEKVESKENCASVNTVGQQKTKPVEFIKNNENVDEKILLPEEIAKQELEAETGKKSIIAMTKMLITERNDDNKVLTLKEITKQVLEAESGNDQVFTITNTDEHDDNKNLLPTEITEHILEDKSGKGLVPRVKNSPMHEKEGSNDSTFGTLQQPCTLDARTYEAIGTACTLNAQTFEVVGTACTLDAQTFEAIGTACTLDAQKFEAIGTAVRILHSQKIDAECWSTHINLILKETRAFDRINRAKIAQILMEHHFVNIFEKYFQVLGSSASESHSANTFKITCNSSEINTTSVSKMNTAPSSEVNTTEVKLVQYMIQGGGGTWLTLKKIFTIVWVLCDASQPFCQYILDSKLMNPTLIDLLRYLTNIPYMSSEKNLYLVKAILGILHNIVRHLESSKWTLRDLEVVPLLQSLLSGSMVQIIRAKVLIILSYLISEAENEIINSDDRNIAFIIRVLSSAIDSDKHFSATYGMDVEETLRGLNSLAINDSNKVRIVRNNALPLYSRILAEGNGEEVHMAVCGLWSLGFSPSNKQKIRDTPGILERLQELQHQCVRKDTSHAARGVVWELESIPITASITDACTSPITELLYEHSCPHVMISYQWDSQPIMMKIKDKLRHAEYKVWMDVEHMTVLAIVCYDTGTTSYALEVHVTGETLPTNAEKLHVHHCRTSPSTVESEYVYRLRKDFIPLRLQPTYTPDGWLGMMVGTRLYFDFSDINKLDTQLTKLIKELGNRGKIGYMDTVDAPLLERVMSRETSPTKAEMDVQNWTTNNVATWLTTLGLENKKERFIEIDGSLLLELRQIHQSAPEFLYTMLRTDYGLMAAEALNFFRALRALNP